MLHHTPVMLRKKQNLSQTVAKVYMLFTIFFKKDVQVLCISVKNQFSIHVVILFLNLCLSNKYVLLVTLGETNYVSF